MGPALQCVREEDSRLQECEQIPRAGGDLGTFESGRKISGAGAQWATGVPLRETRLQGAGAQTLGLHTVESGVWDLFSAHHKSDLSLSSAVSPGCGPTSWAGPQDPPRPAIASFISTSPPTLWTLYTPHPSPLSTAVVSPPSSSLHSPISLSVLFFLYLFSTCQSRPNPVLLLLWALNVPEAITHFFTHHQHHIHSWVFFVVAFLKNSCLFPPWNYKILKTGSKFHSVPGTEYIHNVCRMQKHICLSEQMVSSLNFSRARLGVLPTVAARSAFHHCQSIWRQSDHQVLFSYLSSFLMLTVAPQTDFILGGEVFTASLEWEISLWLN